MKGANQLNEQFKNHADIWIKCKTGIDNQSLGHAQFFQVFLKPKIVTKLVYSWMDPFLNLV